MDIGRDLLCICFEGCSITFMAKICRTFISLTLLTSCPNVFVLSPNMQGRENVEMKYCRICSNNWCYCLRRDSKKGFLGQIKKKHCCFWDKENLGGMSCFLLEIRLLMTKKCISISLIGRNYLTFCMHLLAFGSAGWNLWFTWFLLFLDIQIPNFDIWMWTLTGSKWFSTFMFIVCVCFSLMKEMDF